MSVYTPIGGASNMSQFVSLGDACFQSVMSHQYGPDASAPSVKPTGTTWICSDGDDLGGTDGPIMRWWNGSAWVVVMDLRAGARQINDQGTVPMDADLDMDGNLITGLGTPTADDHAATKLYVDGLIGSAVLADGTVAMTADLDFDGNKGVNVATPTNPGDAANKAYVDAGGPSHVVDTVTTSVLRVTLGFVPSRLYGFFGNVVRCWAKEDAGYAVNTAMVQTVSGVNTTVKFLDGSLPAPDNILGFSIQRASSTSPLHALVFRD